MKPGLHTDAFEDDQHRTPPMIFLGGPIKHWWTCWGSVAHEAYVTHRTAVRALLIERGYMTYAPWDAIKGTWNPAAQKINDAAIEASDLLIILTPRGIPADGTEEEVDYAKKVGTPRLWVPPSNDFWWRHSLAGTVAGMVGPGVPYDD